MLTLTGQLILTGDTAADRERAHAFVDAVLDAQGAVQVVQTVEGEEAVPAGVPGERDALSPEALKAVLEQLDSGEIGRPFNSGERAMLLAIAAHAPAPFDFEENRALLGSGAKFGNVSSGLARRFWNRGYELPYSEAPTGYQMTEEAAEVVKAVLQPQTI